METIKKYLKTCGVLNLIVMGITLFTSLYVFLIERALIQQYINSFEGTGTGIGLGFLLVFFIIAAVIMLAFALGELIIGLVLLTNAKRTEFKNTPVRGVVAGVVAMLLSAAGFAFFCIFSFDTAGISVVSRVLYGAGLLVCVGSAIANIVFSVLIRNEEMEMKKESVTEFFY